MINENFKKFMIRIVILVAIIFLSRVLFQFPVEYFGIKLFKQTAVNRLFSKIDALQVCILVGVFFGFYFRNRISKLDHPEVNVLRSVLLVLGAELTIAIYYLIRASTNYFSITGGTTLYIIQAGILLSLAIAAALFALAVFSFGYIKSFIKEFKKELMVTAAAAVILYILLMLFQQQWRLFSTGVSVILIKAFSYFYPVTYSLSASGGPLIRVSDFTVSIGPPCSGIDSMFLFFAFFAGLFALDHARLRKGRYFILWAVGIVGVYAVNILRLFLLILAGILISPKFAVGLFHTNAGWLLFVIYFLGYYLIIRKFIYKDKLPKVSK